MGMLTFLRADKTEPSLHRNGKLGTRRAADGGDLPWFGSHPINLDVVAHDGRKEGASMHTNGFELHSIDKTTAQNLKTMDLYDHVNITNRYYPIVEDIARRVVMKEIEDTILQLEKESNGNSNQFEDLRKPLSKIHVFPFDHNIRHKTGASETVKDQGVVKNSQQKVQPGLGSVHTDYTLVSAPKRLTDLMNKQPGQNDTWRDYKVSGEEKESSSSSSSRSSLHRTSASDPLIPSTLFKEKKIQRWLMLNVWKSIDTAAPIAQFPLAMCDYATCCPTTDCATFEIHYPDRIGENYFVLDNTNNQDWFYFPNMEYDEAIVMKQWDSEGKLHQQFNLSQENLKDKKDDIVLNLAPKQFESGGKPDFVFHGAIDLKAENPTNLPTRRSLEVRCFVLVEA